MLFMMLFYFDRFFCLNLFKNDPSRITGKYCECDNESCDRYLSVVCAGNGRCECGICKCYAGWTKSDCSCSTNNSSCVSTNGV
jgi:integrin beta 1